MIADSHLDEGLYKALLKMEEIMNFKDVEKIIELFSQKQIAKMSLKEGEFELHLENKDTQPINAQPQIIAPQAPTPQPAIISNENTKQPAQENGLFIESPMVGTFYRCPSPNADPYIKVGDKVKKGQVIGIVEAMKIMNEIEADFDCKIIEIVADDAQPVEFGSKLIRVEKI